MKYIVDAIFMILSTYANATLSCNKIQKKI